MHFLDKQRKRLGHAFAGVLFAVQSDHAFQMQFFLGGIFVGVFWFVFHPLSQFEATLLLLAWSLVLITELQNTASETVLDLLHPAEHDAVKNAKDMNAGAVLIAALFTLGVVLTIAYNHLF